MFRPAVRPVRQRRSFAIPPTLRTARIVGSVRHIAIEGAIGAGKTSLVHLLAADLDARPVLELVEENPFLTGGFYHDLERFAFDTQMFFLLSRLRQQREVARTLAAGEGTVLADYCFDKDNIFALLTLGAEDYRLYERVFRAFRAELPAPDLVVYLRATTDVLLRRIRRRDRFFERTIREPYVDSLNRSYEEYFASFSGPAHVTVDVSSIDWVGRPADYEAIRAVILRTIANIDAGQGSFDLFEEEGDGAEWEASSTRG
ncbi:MAG: deoxynucleoside kinase [Gemmatimonadetes bacterium]|nr:deoxynucleoside kinase [Gemmatimonadota bacterium]